MTVAIGSRARPGGLRLVVILALLAMSGCTPVSPAQTANSVSLAPNIIVILADDLGYGDTGIYGSKIIKTPHIDALARRGVRFTRGYVTHPVCAPSRAALVTGRYQQRFGFEFNPVGRDDAGGVDLREVTIAQLMRQQGYHTGLIGKWHLGRSGDYYPTNRGFDDFFGMTAGGSTYLVDPRPGDELYSTPETEISTSVGPSAPIESAAPAGRALRLAAARARFPIERNGSLVVEREYLTDAFTREAKNFITRNADRPFFLYLAYNAPHTPLQATKRYIDRYQHITDPGQRVYAAMVSALDDGVGEIVAQLRAQGLERRTLIVFLSDNGCAGYLNGACSNAPLSGYKATPLEGGVRVPFIMTMPGRLPGNRVVNRPVSTLDILPTALGLTGAKPPAGRAYDGINLLPYLTRNRSASDRTLFWRAGEGHAVLRGADKLIVLPQAPAGSTAGYVERVVGGAASYGLHTMLYDLSADPGETRNLALRDPRRANELAKAYAAWNAALRTPAWPSRRVVYIEHDGRVLDVRN